MKEDELERRSWAVAQDRWKKMGHKPIRRGEEMDSEIKEEVKEKKYDENGHEIIAENVPIIISANICEMVEEDE